MRALPLGEIVRELGENPDFLGPAERGRPGRHRGLRAVFEHSWRLLTSREQAAFRGLAVFQGGFRLEAAREVTGASLPVLMALTDKSLLRRSPDGRYSLHVLLGQYAREKLAEHPGEEAGARERHGHHFFSRLASLVEAILGPDGPAALRTLDEELGNIRSAWRWAVAGRRAEELGRAALPALRYFNSRTRFREGFALYGEAAALGEGETAGAHPLALGVVLTAQAWFAMRQGHHDEAARLAGRGLTLVPAEHVAALHNHNTLGFIAAQTGHYAEAERRYRWVLAWTERRKDEPRQASLLLSLAGVEVMRGHLDKAERLARRSLALCERLSLSDASVGVLSARGTVALVAGRLGGSPGRLRAGAGPLPGTGPSGGHRHPPAGSRPRRPGRGNPRGGPAPG